ncbi:AraC family transcriptional regulator [Brucella endophytica]|uniref:AraC family transcriptional regulator n=1 Tax=Brucella endophytica TaxID=1963359 RepID=A0A916SCQ9_9HYPH|nr:AraC family transcriptional regulator [Brucella endophytica]GGA92998.1 AraC family transcriptional regulator [Brucella endophytica]
MNRRLPSAPDRTSPAGLAHYIAGRTLQSADGPAWQDVFIQIFSHNATQQPFLVPAVAEPLIVWIVSGRAAVEERDLGGDWTASRVSVGDFFLTRSPVPYELRWRAEGDEPFKVMHLYLSVPLFEKMAREITGQTSAVTLRDVSGERDEMLSHMLALLHEELKIGAEASPLFVQGLAQSLAAHLVRRYAASDAKTRPRNALPGAKLRRAVAHMEAHLDRPFDLKQLAQAVGLSAFHFTRLFRQATGLPPSRYFIQQRILKAQQLLQETDASIIEIGMAVGYSSPSHFAQIFRRETGISPSTYRRD